MSQYKVFCARCQSETPHNAELVNKEIICTCSNHFVASVKNEETGEISEQDTLCGRVIKVSAELSAEQIKEYFQKHKDSNQGHIVIDEVKLAEERKVQEETMVNALADLEIK